MICEYNFTVSRPYLMQAGNLLSSNQTDALSNFYGFSSNTKKQNILTQYGIRLTPLTLSKYRPTPTISYLIDTFVTKYDKLSTKTIQYGPATKKVPGENILIYEGNTTLDQTTLAISKSSTIIVRNGNLQLSGSIL